MINKIKILKKYFWKTEGMDFSNPLSKTKGEFQLFYEKTLIGILTYEDDFWQFKYSDEFIINNDFKPIIDFPDKNKLYSSQELWPFFATRIPSINQPFQFKKIKRANINNGDSVALLKLFGNETITNPFKLSAL